jgi:hypothetical protein
MVVGVVNNSRKFYTYRCPPNGGCQRRSSIGAEKAEQIIIDAVKARTADVEGQASRESRAREAEAELQRAQDALDNAIRTLADHSGERAAKETLDQLSAERDAAEEHVERFGGRDRARRITTANWEDLSLEGRRDLIRATIKRAAVSPSNGGGERITVELN